MRGRQITIFLYIFITLYCIQLRFHPGTHRPRDASSLGAVNKQLSLVVAVEWDAAANRTCGYSVTYYITLFKTQNWPAIERWIRIRKAIYLSQKMNK